MDRPPSSPALLLAALASFTAVHAHASFQEAAIQPAPLAVHDDAAIDWVLPGSFAKAQARAARENRILLIKGVSFGIDSAGAKCATEGTW